MQGQPGQKNFMLTPFGKWSAFVLALVLLASYALRRIDRTHTGTIVQLFTDDPAVVVVELKCKEWFARDGYAFIVENATDRAVLKGAKPGNTVTFTLKHLESGKERGADFKLIDR